MAADSRQAVYRNRDGSAAAAVIPVIITGIICGRRCRTDGNGVSGVYIGTTTAAGIPVNGSLVTHGCQCSGTA